MPGARAPGSRWQPPAGAKGVWGRRRLQGPHIPLGPLLSLRPPLSLQFPPGGTGLKGPWEAWSPAHLWVPRAGLLQGLEKSWGAVGREPWWGLCGRGLAVGAIIPERCRALLSHSRACFAHPPAVLHPPATFPPSLGAQHGQEPGSDRTEALPSPRLRVSVSRGCRDRLPHTGRPEVQDQGVGRATLSLETLGVDPSCPLQLWVAWATRALLPRLGCLLPSAHGLCSGSPPLTRTLVEGFRPHQITQHATRFLQIKARSQALGFRIWTLQPLQ